MRTRSSLISGVVAACFVACTSAYASVPTITRPATECPNGVWFATFTITQSCPTDCPFPWSRLSKKVDGQWEVQHTGCGAPPTQAEDLHLEPGEYKLEGVCYDDSDENWPPESGWEVCAYLVSWRATIEVRRKGSTANWSGGTNVAAGGKGSDVHKADILVTADPPVAGLEVTVSIPDGYGAGSTRTACPAALSASALTTGSDGLATATFTSSNKVEDVPLKLKPVGVDHVFGTATVHQRWDHQNGGEWEYEPYFIPNAYSDVSWTLEIDDGGQIVPIAGHTAKFYAQRVIYYEWDDDQLDYVEHDEERGPDNNWDLSFYSEFDPPQKQDSPAGVYTSAQIVYEDDVYFDWFVDFVEFRGVDDDTYVQ